MRDALPGRDWIEVTLPRAMRVSRVWLTTGYEKHHRRTGDLLPLDDHLRRFTVGRAQVLSYFEATGRPAALLINSNVPVLGDPIHRVVLTARRGPIAPR